MSVLTEQQVIILTAEDKHPFGSGSIVVSTPMSAENSRQQSPPRTLSTGSKVDIECPRLNRLSVVCQHC